MRREHVAGRLLAGASYYAAFLGVLYLLADFFTRLP